MSFSLDGYLKELEAKDLLLLHKGDVTTDIINAVLENAESRLLNKGIPNKIVKRIYNILVEGLQNLYHHAESVPEELQKEIGKKFGLVAIIRSNDQYEIIFANFVDVQQRELLEKKIDHINSLSEAELKEMYKYILNHQKISAKGGGGLGLVDMAKKSRNKIEKKFFTYNNNWYFYCLKIFVS
ncbi:MAG: SiaB family protein kinase [Bacteroidota bacterium]